MELGSIIGRVKRGLQGSTRMDARGLLCPVRRFFVEVPHELPKPGVA